MRIHPPGRAVFSAALVALLVFVLATDSEAQSVDVFVGMRGGLTSSSSPLEAFSMKIYAPSYTSTFSPIAWGATAGVVVNDKFEIRVEAARYPFRYTGQSGTPYPQSSIKWTAVTSGHVWQFPLLVTYRLNGGPFRIFVGGGLSTRSSARGSVTTTTTTIGLGSPTETTTVSTRAYSEAAYPIAVHGSLGFEFRKGWISLRPEMRMGFWTGYRGDPSNQSVGSPTQAEFIVGLRIHPVKAARSFRP